MRTRLVLFVTAMCLLGTIVFAQVNMGSTPTTYSQNFNTLLSSGSGTWADNSTIANWYVKRSGTGTTIAADTGSSNGGNLYSYGSASSSDRALGSLGSGNTAAGNFAWGVLLKNTGDLPISDITISYYGEQWRNSAAAAQAVSFYYKISSTSITNLEPNNSSGWTAVTNLNFSSPITGGTAGSLDGNLAANRSSISYTLTGINLAVNSYILMKWDDPDQTGSDHGLAIDDVSISWEFSSGNTAPVIGDIVQTPSSDIISSTSVSVSASITDNGTISVAKLKWGTSTGSYPYEITMTASDGTTYTTVTNIGAQSNGTTVYYVVYAKDNDNAETTSSEKTYTVNDPATTTIPYIQNFSSGFGDTYTYAKTGTKPWYIYNSDNAACNGYGSTSEEHWLVLPGVNFNNYSGERMTFNTIATYGTIDANNYLKLFYSANYPGLGDPSSYSWTEITFANGGIGGGETSSGVLNLSGINGSMVYLAFKYVSTNNPTRWEVDDISIYLATPTITLNPSTISGFSYVHQSGPSTEKNFSISGSDLTADVSIDAPSDYEISTGTGATFDMNKADPIVLTRTGGSVSETTIYVRLKASLAVGSYNNELITATSSGATDKTVTCNGEVTIPATPVAPNATTSTSVESNSFTAEWGSVSGATGYYLDVYTKSAGSTATDLFFSEYIEGSSNNKYIEIFNGTGVDVDLSGYYLRLIPNGVVESGNGYIDNQLSGTLANGATIVYKNGSAALPLPDGVTATTNTAVNFNGDDAIALYRTSTASYVDIFGRIGEDPGTQWGTSPLWTINTTLVRKSSVSVGVSINPTSGFPTLTTEWDYYAQDTATYLGSHTFSGGITKTYVSGYNNKDVSNVTSYSISGLDPETTYYYVVRAYDAYSQTSVNSNEIEVTTTEAIPEVVVNADGSATGATIVTGGSIPASLQGPDTGIPAVLYTITSTGTRNVTVYKPNSFNGDWYCWLDTPSGLLAAANPIASATTYYVFSAVDFDAKGDVVVIVNDNSTLPVELSSFTALVNGQNMVSIQWVTQSETNLNGYYVNRSASPALNEAIIVSPLIGASNTSNVQLYQFTDTELVDSGTYYYWLQVQEMDGSIEFHGPISVIYNAGGDPGNHNETPIATEITGIYPNPFNPIATVRYALTKDAQVNMVIYNARGQIIRSVNEGFKTVGTHPLIWDGKDNSGRNCSTGVYFFKMQAGNVTSIKKAVLMK